MSPTSAEADGSRLMLLFREYEVETPAPLNVRASTTQMLKELRSIAPGLFQRVSQDSKPSGIEIAARHESLDVGSLREQQNRGGTPSGINGSGAEGVADDVAQQDRLSRSLERLRTVIEGGRGEASVGSCSGCQGRVVCCASWAMALNPYTVVLAAR